MSGIAAVVLCASRAAELHAVETRLVAALSPSGRAESRHYSGRQRAALLLRVLPDPLNREPQPLSSGPADCVFDGYWLPDDHECTLPLAVAKGPRGLTQGDGVFSFAAWNPLDEVLTVGVDKLGMRPLYRADLPGGGFAVASEAKGLLAAGLEPRLCTAALEELYRFGYPLDDLTVLEGVRRLGPAGWLVHRDGRTHTGASEEFLTGVDVRRFRLSDFVEASAAALQTAVRRQLRLASGATPMVTISGGLDSRRILSALLAAGAAPVLLTVDTKGQFGPPGELPTARRVAAVTGLPLTVVEFPPANTLSALRRYRDLATDFETDEHLVYTVSALAGPRLDHINFDGLAGDTLHNPAQFLTEDALAPGGEARFLAALHHDPGWLRLPNTTPPFVERLQQVWTGLRGHHNRFSLFALHTRSRRELSLGPLRIQECAFPSFLPFLDREVMRLALAVPPEVKVSRLLQRDLIAGHGHPELAVLPSTRDALKVNVHHRADGLPVSRAARARLLSAVVGPPLGDGIRLPFRERMKLMAAAVMPRWLRREAVVWQVQKATEWERLRHLMDTVGSSDVYLNAWSLARRQRTSEASGLAPPDESGETLLS